MTLRCVSFPNSISGAVSGANAHLSMCELVAMMVPALSFAATILECGPAPLEHGLECGLAHVGLGPRHATPFLPFAAPVGLELVSGTPGDVVRACEVATVTKVFISGILMVFEWSAWTGAVSEVDAALCEFAYMDALFGAAAGEVVGTVAVFTAGFLVPDLKDHSSRVFISLSAVHLCSPVGSMRYSGTWNLPAAIACAFCFQSLLAAMLAACFYVPGLLFKGMEKDGCKKRKISSSFLPGRDLLQASCLIRVEGYSALASAELEARRESCNNIIVWDDVSDAVVTESPEYQCATAAFEGTSSFIHSGPWEAQHKAFKSLSLPF